MLHFLHMKEKRTYPQPIPVPNPNRELVLEEMKQPLLINIGWTTDVNGKKIFKIEEHPACRNWDETRFLVETPDIVDSPQTSDDLPDPPAHEAMLQAAIATIAPPNAHENQSTANDPPSLPTSSSTRNQQNQKPKSSCCVIIFFSLISLIMIGSGIAYFWSKDQTKPKECESSECHVLSAKILENMNWKSDVCQDFWNFSCGGWAKSNPIPESMGVWTRKLKDQSTIKSKIFLLLNAIELKEDESKLKSSHFKLKKYHESCLNHNYATYRDEVGPLKAIIQNLGGWYSITTFQSDDFDFQRVLRKLHAEYRVSPFFHVEVVPDPFAPSQNIIQISPTRLTIAPFEFYYRKSWHPVASTFKAYVKEVLKLLGSTSVWASKKSDFIYSYEGRIWEAISETANPNISNPTISYRKLRVDQLKNMSSAVFWIDVIIAMFPKANLGDDTEVLITSVGYLKSMSEIIRTTDKAVLNDYLMWSLVHKYVPYLPKQYLDMYEILRGKTTGNTASQPRMEFCVDEMLKHFAPVINTMLAENCDGRDRKISKVQTIFDTIKEVVLDQIKRSPNVPIIVRNWALNKTNSIGIQVGTTSKMRIFSKELYRDLELPGNDSFENAILLEIFCLQLQPIGLIEEYREMASSFLPNFLKTPFKFHFDRANNTILFPETALQMDDFMGRQQAIVYGTIGVELADAFLNAFAETISVQFENDTRATEQNDLLKIFQSVISSGDSCWTILIKNLNLVAAPKIRATRLQLAGVETAMRALSSIRHFDSQLPSSYLKQFNPFGIMLISYAQSQCSLSVTPTESLQSSDIPDNEQRVRRVTEYFIEFQKVFRCESTEINFLSSASFTGEEMEKCGDYIYK